MYQINQTETFKHWLIGLKDIRAKAHILKRIKRAEQGNFGEYKSVGAGVYEMKADIGKGYRVYYAQQGQLIYLLLSGGDKSTQQTDIQNAKQQWQRIKETS
jgi:probable addiction module killer protein